VSARDARTGTDRARATARRDGSRGAGARVLSEDDRLVVGTVPPAVRVTGVLLCLAGLTGIAAAFPTYLVVAGAELRQVHGLGGALVALLVPAVQAAVGVSLIRRAAPKFGLAYASVAGGLAVGALLIELYRGRGSTSRPGVEVLAGERVLTSGIQVGAGWVLGVVALLLAVAAGAVAGAAWGRTVMEDRGALDAVRSVLAGSAVLLGVATVLCLSLPAADVPDELRTDPATGLQTVVTREGPQALLERPELALLGGLLLAGALLLCSVVAPSLRPRLAAVGGLLALTVAVLAAGLGGLRDAAYSDELVWTVPGAGLVFLGLAFAALTTFAWRARRTR
jgi:iron complex transport system permease protein